METAAVNRPVADLPNESDRVQLALGSMYMGVICSHCGSDKVIRAGACGVCTQCGTSQGCS
jgi:ribonucleoside-diphosphate reductase alpha chain